MKFTSLLTGLAMVSLITVGSSSLQAFGPAFGPVAAAEVKQTESPAQKNIALITKSKGQIGSGDQLRRFFYGDLEPIGLQVGGAGHVVNLYNKANDVTFSYCSTYDVVVAVKKGKVAMFAANEVK